MTSKDHWAVGLSDDEARELSILLGELSSELDGHEEADVWSERLWQRRLFRNPSGPEATTSE